VLLEELRDSRVEVEAHGWGDDLIESSENEVKLATENTDDELVFSCNSFEVLVAQITWRANLTRC
jgi:hypothetical protein